MMNCSNVTLHKLTDCSVMKLNPPIDLNIQSWVKPIMYKDLSSIDKKADFSQSTYVNKRLTDNTFEISSRKKKIAIQRNICDLPWILSETSIGSSNNKFIGRRETSSLSSRYFILAKGSNSFEAYPVSEWLNFSRTVNFRYLNADQAEEQFKARNKTLNLSFMMKHVHNDDEDTFDAKIVKTKKDNFWLNESDHSDSNSSIDLSEKRLDNCKSFLKKRNKDTISDDEREDDSDEGDFESRECEYFSDTPVSSNDDDQKVVKESSSSAKDNASDFEKHTKMQDNNIVSDIPFYHTSSSDDEDFLSTQGKAIKALMEDPLSTKSKNFHKDSSSGETSDDLDGMSIPRLSSNYNQVYSQKLHSMRKNTSCDLTNLPKKAKMDVISNTSVISSPKLLNQETLGLLESEVKKFLIQGPKSGKSIARKLNKIFPNMHPEELYFNISEIMKSNDIDKQKNSEGKILFVLK